MERCRNEVGVNPTAAGDSEGATFVSFANELTEEQKAKLDALMADNPTNPPSTSGTTFVIRDIFSQKSDIATTMGKYYKVYYSESVPGSGNVDQVELHFDDVLTLTQKTKVRDAYAGLIRLK